MGMYSQKGGGGAKVLGKHLAARAATGELKAPHDLDWRMGEGEGKYVGGMPERYMGVWSRMLHDGNSVISLLREHLGARTMGFESAGGEVG